MNSISDIISAIFMDGDEDNCGTDNCGTLWAIYCLSYIYELLLVDIYIQCSLGLSPPRFIANLAYRQNSRLSRFPPLKIPRYTAKLSYRHLPQVFRHKSRKTNLNSPVSTTHNYLLTAVYWSIIMECQDWSLISLVEGRNRWVVLIRIITCIYFSSDYF